jgi:hypothetical protein
LVIERQSRKAAPGKSPTVTQFKNESAGDFAETRRVGPQTE